MGDCNRREVWTVKEQLRKWEEKKNKKKKIAVELTKHADAAI